VSRNSLTAEEQQILKQLFVHDPDRIEAGLHALAQDDDNGRQELIQDLLDLHGPGRVLFRNTRATMQGFPKRIAHLIPIQAKANHHEWVDRLSTEFAVDAGDSNLQAKLDLSKDPRVAWLTELLRQPHPRKVLLICRSKQKALALDEALRLNIKVKVGVFHEDLTLVQRDRNAAWFAEEDGARLLICSEIGSEGRNFQFAHHLVLFDLPLNPELLEQRIGRLDRIGQKDDIQLHIPYLKGSPQEVLSRWYQQGLNAFTTNLEGGNELLRAFGRQVHDLALEFPALDPEEGQQKLDTLVNQTSCARIDLVKKLEEGRDRLLELNSFRPQRAQQLVDAIRSEDQDPRLEEYMLDVFDHFGVHLEELAPHTYQLNAQGIITDAFPSIPEDGLIATFDRKRALSREDVGFLSWDHPMVTGAMDLVLGSEKGNSTFCVFPDSQDRSLLLEALFILETIADHRLHVDRFLAPTPMRILVNHKTEDVGEHLPQSTLEKRLQKGLPFKLLDNPLVIQKQIPKMIQTATALAERKGEAMISEGMAAMDQMLDHEISRLTMLQKVNDHVRPQEIELAQQQKAMLTEAIQNARVRLDSIRLIWKGPPEVLS
jgi:ATP-dependent helicase HepA